MTEALGLSRKVLKTLKILNWIYGGAILALLITSFAEPEWFFRAIGVKPGADGDTIARAMRAMAVIGVATIPINAAILDRLLAMVDTVRAGDPFVLANARRLRDIAWCVLGLEMMHLAIGSIIRTLRATAQHIDMDWSFSLTPLIAVLLIFVLANVFEQGARMRADLEGTV